MSNSDTLLEQALQTALAQYAETMGELFPTTPSLCNVDDPAFWASAEMNGSDFHIRVSTGVVEQVVGFWTSAFSDQEFLASFGRAIKANAADMAHISLVWLMLHELHHFQMGHFDHPKRSPTREGGGEDQFALVRRAKMTEERRSNSPKVSSCDAAACLEMQADHDATEMLLDAYSSEEWLSLRARVTAVSAMMVLIERADSAQHSHVSTHPKAATRIFQLLGHLIDMPMVRAHCGSADTQLPSSEEQEQFAAQVVVPSFFDAKALARVASARPISDDLGSATDFFHDVKCAKLKGATGDSQLVTAGARQWSELVASMAIMQASKLDDERRVSKL